MTDDTHDWQTQQLTGAALGAVSDLDDDLRAALVPFQWMGELRTGKWKTWESDAWALMVKQAREVQRLRRILGVLLKDGAHWQESAIDGRLYCCFCSARRGQKPHSANCPIRLASEYFKRDNDA